MPAVLMRAPPEIAATLAPPASMLHTSNGALREIQLTKSSKSL